MLYREHSVSSAPILIGKLWAQPLQLPVRFSLTECNEEQPRYLHMVAEQLRLAILILVKFAGDINQHAAGPLVTAAECRIGQR